MTEIIILLALLLFILALIFWPRRDPHTRRVTKSHNGRRYGTERELY